jgi:hypothetical protein
MPRARRRGSEPTASVACQPQDAPAFAGFHAAHGATGPGPYRAGRGPGRQRGRAAPEHPSPLPPRRGPAPPPMGRRRNGAAACAPGVARGRGTCADAATAKPQLRQSMVGGDERVASPPIDDIPGRCDAPSTAAARHVGAGYRPRRRTRSMRLRPHRRLSAPDGAPVPCGSCCARGGGGMDVCPLGMEIERPKERRREERTRLAASRR